MSDPHAGHDDWPGIDLEHLPGPTPWPAVLGLGMTLLGGGLVVNPFRFLGLGVSVVGLLLLVAGGTAVLVVARNRARGAQR